MELSSYQFKKNFRALESLELTGSRLRTHFDEILKDGWDRKFDVDYDGQGFGAPQSAAGVIFGRKRSF